MKDLFVGSEPSEVKANRLKKYMESGRFLETLFFPHEFLESLVLFAIQILNSTEPEKKSSFVSGGNESRYIVLRLLNKFSLKRIRNTGLVHALHCVLRNDNLPNVILSLKALGSLSRSGVIAGDLVEVHVGVLLGMVHNLFTNLESGEEGLIEISLFTLTEMLTHARVFFRGLEYHAVKIDQFLACVYGNIRRAFENRRFMDGMMHKRTSSISMCSGICSLLKLTYEQLPIVSKSGPYHVFACEAAFVGMYYCPSDLLDLRKEIYMLFSKMCIGDKEMVLPMMDKVYMVPFLFSPDAQPMSVKGIGMLSEMLVHVKENLSKAAYMEFGSKVFNVLFSTCSSIRRLCKEVHEGGEERQKYRRNASDIISQDIESLIVCLGAVENTCKCFGGRTGDSEELSHIYLKSFYDIRNGFEGIQGLVRLGCAGKEEELKKVVKKFVSGFREVIGRAGILEKSGNGIVFSVPEINILYEIFERSFDVFLHECLCQEQDIEEFFSVLSLVREHIGSDIVKCLSERIVEYSKKNGEFFGIWRLMSSSVILGNTFCGYVLPRMIEELDREGFEFVKRAMRYIVPFFGNDIKKIKRVNTFFMHRIISTLLAAKRMENFEILLEIFNMFGSMPEKSSFFQKYIFDNFSRIVSHLMNLYEVEGKSIFIEMIFSLPISINLLESDIQFLMRPIEEALMLHGPVRTKALSILVYVLDFSTPDKISGLEKTWQNILNNVAEGLKDSTMLSLCSRILGKLKSYHKTFVVDGKMFEETNEDLKLIRIVVDGKHAVPGHLLFFDAVQKIRGAFELSEKSFGPSGVLTRFRSLGPRCGDGEAKGAAFRLVEKVVCHLMGWNSSGKNLIQNYYESLLEEMEEIGSIPDTLDYIHSVHGVISSLGGRKCSDSRHLAQYVYDAILTLFSCHGTPFEKKALELLHSIFGVVILHKISTLHRPKGKRYTILLDTDTFLDALVESFCDTENSMPFKVLSVMFVQMYEMFGRKCEYFCVEMYRAVFSKLKAMCKSSNKRCRDAGINGIICLAATMPIRELVMLRVPEDSFSCTYLYLLPRGSEDFSLPLRLVVFILRFRYKGIRNYLLSSGMERHFMMSHFRPFVAGLFDGRKDVMDFSQAVLREVFQSYGPRLLERHKDMVFGFFKKEYVIGSRETMIMHLKVFIFCVREGKCPFDDCEMKYLIEKFLDGIASNEEWRGTGGVYMGFDHCERDESTNNEDFCKCNRCGKGEEDTEIVLGGIHKKLSSLSMRDLMEIALKNKMDVVCGDCKKKIYRHKEEWSPRFSNEGEELIYWIREFYLLVIEYRKSFEEIRTAVLYLLRYVSDDSSDYLQKAHNIRPQETEEVISEEVEKCLSEKVDYKILNMLLCAHSISGIRENPRVGMLVLKILKEFRIPKEFAIIAQNDRYSMLAKAYEIGIRLKNQEGLCNEILETYFVLDGYAKSYTSRMYPRMIKYVEDLGSQFVSCMFRRIQDPSAYELCSQLCKDSAKLREMVFGMKDRLAERISQIYCRLEGNDSIEKDVFVYSYRFLDLAGYEMKPVDIQVILGIYADVKTKPRHAVEMRGLINRCIDRFSPENLETLFNIDPWFMSVDGIDPGYLTEGLSPLTLRGIIRSIDKRNRPMIENLSLSLGENRHMLIEMFVEMGIRSEKLIGYCKENLHITNLRGLLLYYLCTFEPLHVYFELLFKLPYEDRKYTLYCLERIVDVFDPLLFEEIILIVLRSEVRFKTSLCILFPLLLSRPSLISKKIVLELTGSIYKLLDSENFPQQRMGFKLFEVLYNRCLLGDGSGNICREYDWIIRNIYTLMFVRFIHMDQDLDGDLLEKYNLELVFELVEYSPKELNLNNMFSFLEAEILSKKNEEYKIWFLKSIGMAIAPYFRSRALGIKVIEYLVRIGMWNYKLLREELGVVVYDPSLLYNLLCMLCSKAGERAGLGCKAHRDDVENMEICLIVIRHLFAEYNRERGEANQKYVEEGLEKLFYVLSLYSEMKNIVCSVTRLFVEAFKDNSSRIDPLVSKISFLMSDFRTSLADKIEMACLLSNRGHDNEFLSEMLLPAFNNYLYSGVTFPSGLQKFFMKGVSSKNSILRNGYLDLMNRIVPVSKWMRLKYLLEMEWKHNAKIGYTMTAMMILSCHTAELEAEKYSEIRPSKDIEYPWSREGMRCKGNVSRCSGLVANLLEDVGLYRSKASKPDLLEILYHFDDSLLPVLSGVLRTTVCGLDSEKCKSIFEGFVKFCSEVTGEGKLLGALVRGLGPIYRHADLYELIKVFRGGEGWYTLLEYADDRQKTEIYRRLMNLDEYFGMSRSVCIFPETMQAYFLQQVGKTKEAQDLYEEIQARAGKHKISFDEREYKLWQDEWVACAKELQQWDVCYDAGVEIGDGLLSGESLWHLSNFTSQKAVEKLKSVIGKGVGFEREFLDVFADIFMKYSAERIKGILTKNIAELRSYPVGSGANLRNLMYLQIIIEMVEAEPIFNDKIDSIEALTSISFRWKDKEPSIYSSFAEWSLFKTWRKHVYSRLGMGEKMCGREMGYKQPERGYTEEMGNSLGRKPIASHLFSPKEMNENYAKIKKELVARGTNELAKTLNMFSKAAIDHGYYDVALFHLKEVFDLSSVKVGDAFQKVVYELLCFLGKKEYKIGAEQCMSANIQHFSDTQNSVLFNIKGLFNEKLGKASDAEKFYLQSAQICNTVGENWLTWASFLFGRIDGDAPEVKEDVFVALLQAITYCNGPNARKGILKMILLMGEHSSLCDVELFHKVLQEIDISRFIYFIPQLIGLLEKEDSRLVQAILGKISEEYPQAVIGPLKAAKERIRRSLGLGKEDIECKVGEHKVEGRSSEDSKSLGTGLVTGEKNMFLENVMCIYNRIKNAQPGKEFWKILHYLHNSLNSFAFKEEELVYLEIEKIFNSAVSHVVHGAVPSGLGHAKILNELIFQVSVSSLSRKLKEELTSSILKMRCICPLENIDEMVRFKSKVQKIVEESFHRMDKSEESEVNLLLYRSDYKHRVFGQYSEIRRSYKSLASIEMFEPRQPYMYRKRMGCNRIHLRGSDGKMYRYEMKELRKMRFSEFVLPQISLMINEAMGEDTNLRRRGAELRLFVPFIASEVLALKWIKEPVYYMDSILEEGLSRYKMNIDQCVLLYLDHFATIYDGLDSSPGHFENRYQLEKGLTASLKPRIQGDECPNIRKKKGFLESKESQENLINNVRMVIERQREKYTSGLRQNEVECLGCNERGEGISPCTYRYETSKRQRYMAYEKVYNTFKKTSFVDDYFKLIYGNLGGYFRFKNKLLSSYSANSVFLYTFSVVDRRPRNLAITKTTGCFMNRDVCCEEAEISSKGKGMGAIGPGYQKLFGKEGIEGTMVSIMYHYAGMVNKGDWSKDLVKALLEGRFIDMTGKGLKGAHKEMLSRVSEMIGKGEDGTHNVIPMVSEWMDMFKLAQIDPRHMCWM
ncbi:PI3/PI4 protein kinase [Encephalitozoon intestinalis ATCC 50506]|uniref:PI3/PI4 protein kinase n=1 Tax=Encephalitozoon intestinalis (strain ATCC 50506) TaxID=876142 RepID=E0S776_ENCIT|nr:PI3/PI4 protein kinase [Encephalitozoon intestinalis ATCC 50506]ADM11504.1 PI3/PI4 protein kinase [Encephalitozoon intestinalis ATCC 50506]UTX45217.1 focal adhesion kinase [Encephalitozoon intestinalis]